MARCVLIGICLMMLAVPAYADVFKYVDEGGVVTLTDVPKGGMTRRQNLRHTYKTKPANIYIPPDKYTFPESRLQLSSDRTERYKSLIDDHASRHSLDPKLLEAVIKTESNFNAGAISRKGALGLMQLMPTTASDMGVSNPMDPDQNISGGARYLKYLVERFSGNLTLALAAYNAGPLNVEKYGTVPPFAETKNYVKKIFSLYRGDRNVKQYASGAYYNPSYKSPDSIADVRPKREKIYKIALADGTVLYTNSSFSKDSGNRIR